MKSIYVCDSLKKLLKTFQQVKTLNIFFKNVVLLSPNLKKRKKNTMLSAYRRKFQFLFRS